ncbi:4-hydroxy-3-methylbut-2-enyl diphosphate reductase [Streptomyces sp. YIM 121038]|nr:4-hydroxy-3-methylbut-2-enyl diphosphate reductase [Streptomyces sp. YIM 121038]
MAQVSSPRGVVPTVDEEVAARQPYEEATRFVQEGYDVPLIGHEGHEEVVGTDGEAPDRITLAGGRADVSGAPVPGILLGQVLGRRAQRGSRDAETAQVARGKQHFAPPRVLTGHQSGPVPGEHVEPGL